MLPLVQRVIPGAVIPALPTVDLEDRAFDLTTADLGFTLRNYQHVARRRLRQYKRQLLADGMRMGKTVEIISSHEITDGPLLVIAPLATRKVWTDWMKRRWPHEPIAICEGNTYDPTVVAGKNLIFMHYDILGAWQTLGSAVKVQRIVLDEAHKVSKRKGRWMQALIMIAANVPNFVAATGTPLWNMPVDLWGALNMLAPGAWGTWVQYAIRYCGGRSGPYGLVCDGPTNSDEMRARMGELMLRRTWEDVSDELPKIDRSVEVLGISKADRRKIDSAVEQLQTTTDHKTYVGKMAQYRRLLGDLKVERAVDLAEELLRAEEPVVIWTWHVDTAERIVAEIQKSGYEASMISGRQPQSVRDNRIDTWRLTNGALVVTLSTGQAGIDLSHARHCIFAELDWTPAVIAQAEMRTFSIARPMTVTYLAVDHEADQDRVPVAYSGAQHRPPVQRKLGPVGVRARLRRGSS